MVLVFLCFYLSKRAPHPPTWASVAHWALDCVSAFGLPVFLFLLINVSCVLSLCFPKAHTTSSHRERPWHTEPWNPFPTSLFRAMSTQCTQHHPCVAYARSALSSIAPYARHHHHHYRHQNHHHHHHQQGNLFAPFICTFSENSLGNECIFSFPWMYFTMLPILLNDQTKNTSCFTNHPGCGILNANTMLMSIWSTFQHPRIVIFTETKTKLQHKICTWMTSRAQGLLLKVAKSCDTAEQFKINLVIYKSMCLYTRQLRNWGLEIRMLTNLSLHSSHFSTRNQESQLKLFVRIDL